MPEQEEKKSQKNGWEITLRVRYSETDKMGIVYHANYFPWFEMGRTEFCRSLGISYKEWEERGIFLPCVEVRCRYKRPALYDDLLVVRTVIEKLERCSVSFGYEVLRQETLLAQGYTKHAFTNTQGALMSTPEPFYGMLQECFLTSPEL